MKKIFLTTVLSLLLLVNGFSVNMVSNGTFENTTDNYAWAKVTTSPGVQTVGVETGSPITGTKSAKITITTAATTITDYANANKLSMYALMSNAKAATYKIKFKALATNAIDISGVQMTVKVTNLTTTGTAITNQTVTLTGLAETYELTFTNTTVCGYNYLQFQYGNFPAGTTILIDDVSVQEVTNPLTNGNLCNGDFEAGVVGKGASSISGTTGYLDPTGWTQIKTGGSFSASASITNPISGLKSYKVTMGTTSGSSNADYMVGWAFNAVVGKKYTCTFKAKSSVASFDAGIKLVSYNGAIVNFDNITGVPLTSTAQSFTFTSNAITDYVFYYVLCIQVGTLPASAYIQLDDVEIYQSELETPTVSTATAISSSGFTANWTVVPRASSYDVLVYQGATLVSTTNISGQATSSLAIAGLTANTDYTYTVVAKGNGTSTFDSEASEASAVVSTYNNISVTTATTASSLGLTASDDLTVTSTGSLTIDASATLNDLTIERGGKVTNNSGQTLTASSLTINSDASGTGTYVDNGTTAITTATVNQYLTTGRNWYFSSPVASAPRSVVTNASNIYSRNEGTAAWDTESGSLTPAKGYVAEVTSTGTVSFTGGGLNTGAQSIVLTVGGATFNGYNLVGNPYPSYVDWTAVTKTNLDPTIWYRTVNGGGTYVFDTFNGVGTNNNESGDVTGMIPPMQAVWVHATAATTLNFSNSMRSHEIGTNRLKSKSVASQQVLRMQVSNGVNSDEAIVLFNNNASDGYDVYDSPKMSNNNVAVPEIYTVVAGKSLVINGLSSVGAGKELPLGFVTGASNTFTIKATEFSNFEVGTKIILKDNLLNTEQDLTDGTAYNFTSDVASTDSRFTILVKAPSITTGVVENATENQDINIYKNANEQITINRRDINGQQGQITVCNTVGQKLVSMPITGSSTVISKRFTSGVYLVTVTVIGNKTTKKVIIN